MPPKQVNISNCPSSLTTTATSPVTVGEPIHDTAHLNVPAGAGGTVTFHLYSDPGCLTEILDASSTVPVNGPGDYVSADYIPTLPGSYYWIAEYSGDATTDGATTACGDPGETSVVNPIPSTIATVQSVIPNDSATVTGGGSGTVRFRLYSGATCDGTALVDQTKDLVNGAAATTNLTVAVSTDGTYSWLVEYSGDATHTGATSTCSTEHFAVDFTNG